MHHLASKATRARWLRDRVNKLSEQIGQKVVSHASGGQAHSIRVELDECTFAMLHPGRFLRIGWVNAMRIGPVNEARSESELLEIYRFNSPVMQANFVGEAVDIHLYRPGAWELDAGLDVTRDTIAVLPSVFVDPADPAFLEWLAANPRPDPVLQV